MDPTVLGLPHREPFLFIDSIEEHEPGVRALGLKTFSAEEAFFRGHFPGEPIVPGVILVEALAQTAGVAANGPGEAAQFRLCAIRQMKILLAVRPNELIRLHAEVSGSGFGMVQCAVRATVGDKVAAEGQIVLSGAKEA